MFTVARKSKLVGTICFIAGILILTMSGCSVLSQIESGLKKSTPTETAVITLETPSAQIQETPQVKDQARTLVLWVPPQFEPSETNLAGLMLEKRLRDFEAVHPDLKVELRVKDLAGESSLLNSLAATSAAAPEALPGLILLSRSDMEIAALKSLIFPIPSRAAEYNSTDWFSFTADMATTQGVQYGLPLFIDPYVMAYSTKTVSFPPTTWQEVSSQGSPMAVNLDDPFALLPFAIYYSAGGTLLDEVGKSILDPDALTRTYQVIFNGSDTNAFPTWLVDLHSPDGAWEALQQGQATYALTWASQVLRSPAEGITVSSLPGSSTIPVGFVDGWLLCITNPTAELSNFDFLLADYLLEPEFLANWSETSGYLPAQRSVLQQWQNTSFAETLSNVADQSMVVPDSRVQQTTGKILNQYTLSLIRRQTNPMQAVLDSLSALEVK
jgi:multiple sugar transport system substrate-binding protein